MTNDSNSLVIANILFRHKRSRSETWQSSKGVYFEHFILIQKRYQSSLNGPRTRAFPRADINGDSDLLIAIMKLALLSQKINQVTRAKYNFDKLKYLRIMEKFQATICGKSGPLPILENKNTNDLFVNPEKLLQSYYSHSVPWTWNNGKKTVDHGVFQKSYERKALKQKRFKNE